MISWTGLHNLADVIFRTTQKPFYIASSNLVRYIMYVIWIFLNLFCKLMRDHSLVSGPFSFFLWSCSLKGIGFETKNKVNFFKGFLIILFQNILFLKQFLECNSCFSLYCKIKKGSGTSCWCTFSPCFFHKNVPYLILLWWTKFQCHNSFLSQDIKQNALLGSYSDSWWRHKF